MDTEVTQRRMPECHVKIQNTGTNTISTQAEIEVIHLQAKEYQILMATTSWEEARKEPPLEPAESMALSTPLFQTSSL